MSARIRRHQIEAVASVGLGLVAVVFWMIGIAQQAPAARPTSGQNPRSLPDDLATLQEVTGYPGWDRVRGFSRALGHHRQLRFSTNSNIFISETGSMANQVEVIEVILMPPDSSKKVEFGLYDPKSGKRISHYPDSIQFDILGIHGGSRNASPGVCIACHDQRKPLIALVPWTQMLEDDLKRSRATEQGIRPDLIVPVPNDEATRDRIIAFDKIMKDKFPDRINDIREWMAIRTLPETEPGDAHLNDGPATSVENSNGSEEGRHR